MTTPPEHRVGYREVLAVREFRGLLVSGGLSVLGDQIARIAVALLVLERSGSAFAASATYACSYLTWLLGGPLLSALPDRYPRRRVMVACDIARGLLVACLAVPGLSLWVVFGVLIVVGLLAPPADAARSALLADVLEGESYVVANALCNAVAQGGQVAGFILGGALVGLVGVDGALLADAATFAVSAALLLAMVGEHVLQREPGPAASRLTEAAAGFALVWRTRRLRGLLAWGLLSATSVIAAEGLAVTIAEEQGGGPLAAGLLTAAVPAGFLVGSWLLLGIRTDRRERLFPLLVTLTCLPLMATPFVSSLGVIIALWVLAGVGNALQLVANSSFVQAVPAHLRGRAFGVAATLLMVLQGVVLLGAGALAEVTAPRIPIAVVALLSLLAIPLLPRHSQGSPLSRRTIFEMSADDKQAGAVRSVAAGAISLALLALGVVLVAAAGPALYDLDVPLPLLVGALLPVYVFAHRYPLEFEFRRESNNVTLVQLPLALGVMVVAPAAHLAVRLVAALISAATKRQAPQKALFNVGCAALEVGAAAFAVGLVPPGETGPTLWIVLYAGLLVGDVVGALALSAIWRTLRLPASGSRMLRALALNAPVSLIFTGVAVLAMSATRIEPLTALIALALAGWLGLAYRAHRRVLAQQTTTEQLYGFVKDLGPLTASDEKAPEVLERVRALLHAERLDLATPDGGGWSRLSVFDGRPHERAHGLSSPLSSEVATTKAPALRGRGDDGEDTMAAPLFGPSGLIAIVTAVERLGGVRGFEIDDLRMLQTVGAELSIALERGRLHAELEIAATRDPLTGLRNLRELTRRLQELLEADADAGVIVAAVAVDSFREVNDTLGHQVGDELLLEVTARLHAAAPQALIGRIGGGRFAVAVQAGTAGGDAELFGLNLRSRVEGSAQLGPVGTDVRLSVGVVSAPDHGTDAATLVRRAETAMYSARHAHGGPVLWEPAYEVQGQRRLAVVGALREALAGGAIGVAFQPKVEATSGRVTGVEALARWTHPALGSVRPDEFIPLAEASGLMGPLTSTVLRQSLTACRGWQRRAPSVGVAVNVSADTVLDPDFVTEVGELLASVGIGPELLTLELTEGVVVSDPQLAAVRMGELRTLGVKLSVDDFGTGYSSLTYLKGLPIDEVKIDKGFVDGLATDPADRAVVRAVVDIAHTLGLKVVAEGVEQEDQQSILRALGVDEVQGYLHARPMPALEVAAWLRDRELRASV